MPKKSKKHKGNPASAGPVSSAKVEAYCMKCRTKRGVKDPRPIVHPNGKHAITGVCSVCGTKIFRMGKMPGSAPTAAASVEPVEGSVTTEEPGDWSKGKRSKVKIS